MEVREARPDDTEAIRAVHRESIEGLGPGAYDREQVEAWARGVEFADYEAIDADGYYFPVAVEDGDVVGFGCLGFEEPAEYASNADAEVTAVYVHPSVARQGVGSALLSALERRARERGGDVLGLSSSLSAVEFYEAHGYERVRAYVHEFSAHESTGVEGRVVEMRKEL